MRKFLLLLAGMVVVGCGDLKRGDEEFPIKSAGEWITYEGRVPLNDNDYLHMEVSMLPGNPGEGIYTLQETLKTETGSDNVGSFKGTYSTFSNSSGDIEVHFQNSVHSSSMKRTWRSDDGKRIREEQYRVGDLILRKDGEHKLIALDNSHQPISLDPDDNLSKRTSFVFTVEGTFAHVGDSSVFYEVNTNQVWPVAKQGEYYLATRQYHELANLKNQGVYLKGTAFSIHGLSSKGRPRDVLVFKKIIAMNAPQTSE